MEQDRPDDLLDQLRAWAAAESARAAAGARAGTRSLIAQAAAGATWAGILVDLAEASTEVVAKTRVARWQGRLIGAAADFAVIQRPRSGPVMVRYGALASVSPIGPAAPPPAGAPAGDRVPALTLDFAGALDGMAAEGAPLTLWAADEASRGRVLAVGRDVVTFLPDGRASAPVYLRLDGVEAAEVL